MVSVDLRGGRRAENAVGLGQALDGGSEGMKTSIGTEMGTIVGHVCGIRLVPEKVKPCWDAGSGT